MEMNRKTLLRTVMCIGLVCLIWCGYFYVKSFMIDRIVEVKDDNFSWVFQVDSSKTEGKDLVINGFAFGLNRDSEEGAFELILEDIESGKRYFPRMEYSERKDVNDYFLCEYNYENSGFEARIKVGKLDFEKKEYEVLLRVSGERLAYRTGTFFSKGQLMYVEPTKFQAIEGMGDDLERIVENGLLRAYSPEYNVYVYQYEGELYWITDNNYEFDENGRTYIEYQMNTTQVNRLPKYRLEAGWDWSNIGFVFEECSVPLMSDSNWRVAKVSIPTEYSVTKIWTGSYKGEWEWNLSFRPWYEFK